MIEAVSCWAKQKFDAFSKDLVPGLGGLTVEGWEWVTLGCKLRA